MINVSPINPAAPIPAIARKATRVQNVGAAPQPADPTINVITANNIAARRPKISLNFPYKG